MRVVALLVLAGCGRFEFEPIDAIGPPQNDAPGVDFMMSTDDVMSTDASMTVWYRMEDGAEDGRLEDSAGVNQPATCANCGTTIPGHIGQATKFDRAFNQVYQLLSDPSLETPNGWTITLWARFDTLATVQYLIAKRCGLDYDTFGIWADQIDNVIFETTDSGTSGDFQTLTQVPLGGWTHYAITWDTSTKRGYVNGVPTVDVNPPGTLFDGGEILLGADIDQSGVYGHLTGALDEVRIYNRKLSDFEIQQLAAQ